MIPDQNIEHTRVKIESALKVQAEQNAWARHAETKCAAVLVASGVIAFGLVEVRADATKAVGWEFYLLVTCVTTSALAALSAVWGLRPDVAFRDPLRMKQPLLMIRKWFRRQPQPTRRTGAVRSGGSAFVSIASHESAPSYSDYQLITTRDDVAFLRVVYEETYAVSKLALAKFRTARTAVFLLSLSIVSMCGMVTTASAR